MSFENTQQTFFYANTHHSLTHGTHHNRPLATEWKLCTRDSNRASGFKEYRSLGHVDYQGQTTLDMFSGPGNELLPDDLRR